MFVRCCLVLVFFCSLVLMGTVDSHAARKDSFIGKMFETVKEGVDVVKQDVQDYNTFFVRIDIANTSNRAWTVEIWQENAQDGPEFVREIRPYESRVWTFETVAYLGQRNYQVIYRSGNETIDGASFNPSKKDRIVGRI